MSTNAIVVSPAESASAPIVAPVIEAPEISIQERLDKATAPELKTWREKGEIPAAKAKEPVIEPPKTEAPAVSTEPSAEVTPEIKPVVATETAATPEVAKPQKKDADARVQELLVGRKKDRQLIEDLTRKLAATPTPSAQTVAPQTTPEKPRVDAKPVLRAQPQLEDQNADGTAKYKDLTDFNKDLGKWMTEAVKFESERIFAENQATQERKAKESQQSAAQKTAIDKWKERVDKAREKLTDFDEVALGNNPAILSIQQGSVIDAFLMDSDVGPEILYHLAQNPAEVNRIKALNPLGQSREMTKLELKLTEPATPIAVTEIPKADPDPVPARREPPKLPPPPTELSARRSAPVDEADAALARDDIAGYMRAMNARELKARKG